MRMGCRADSGKAGMVHGAPDLAVEAFVEVSCSLATWKDKVPMASSLGSRGSCECGNGREEMGRWTCPQQ